MGISTPTFSIIIPTHRRRRALDACLDALAALSWPHDLVEILVVDDGGGMPLDDVLARHDRALNLRFFRQPHAGAAVARNTGALEARGRYLVFLDDDCRPSANYLREITRAVGHHSARAVVGHTLNAPPSSLFAKASQHVVHYRYRYNTRLPAARFLQARNLVVPRDRFLQMGAFDGTFPFAAAEDGDFSDRWREEGHELVYAESAVVYLASQLGVVGFLGEHFSSGRGAYSLRAARGRRAKTTPSFEPLSFYLDLVRHPLRAERGMRGVLFAGLAALTQLAQGAGYCFQLAISGSLFRRRRASVVARAPSLTDGQPLRLVSQRDI
jgi:glycosyltransferase involved in cell wall biosynthesis